MNDYEKFQKLKEEFGRVGKEMYECLEVYDEPLTGNECYNRLHARYMFLWGQMEVLIRKLQKEGYSLEDLLGERRGD